MIKSPADVKSISAVAIDARAGPAAAGGPRAPSAAGLLPLCLAQRRLWGAEGGAAVLQSLTRPFEHDVSPSCGSGADPVQPRARVRLPRRPQRGRWAVAGAQARRADRRENEPETAGLVAVQVPHTVPARGPAQPWTADGVLADPAAGERRAPRLRVSAQAASASGKFPRGGRVSPCSAPADGPATPGSESSRSLSSFHLRGPQHLV